MPDRAERAPSPGRTLVRRRAISDVVRAAVLGSYGVTGLSAPSPLGRLRCRFRAGAPGIRIVTRDPLEIDVYVTVAHGVPVAEVARQVDSAVRWSVQRALGMEIGRVSIHVDGMTGGPFSSPDAAADAAADTDAGAAEPGPGDAPATGADER